jgi:hypothetical protein
MYRYPHCQRLNIGVRYRVHINKVLRDLHIEETPKSSVACTFEQLQERASSSNEFRLAGRKKNIVFNPREHSLISPIIEKDVLSRTPEFSALTLEYDSLPDVTRFAQTFRQWLGMKHPAVASQLKDLVCIIYFVLMTLHVHIHVRVHSYSYIVHEYTYRFLLSLQVPRKVLAHESVRKGKMLITGMLYKNAGTLGRRSHPWRTIKRRNGPGPEQKVHEYGNAELFFNVPFREKSFLFGRIHWMDTRSERKGSFDCVSHPPADVREEELICAVDRLRGISAFMELDQRAINGSVYAAVRLNRSSALYDSNEFIP